LGRFASLRLQKGIPSLPFGLAAILNKSRGDPSSANWPRHLQALESGARVKQDGRLSAVNDGDRLDRRGAAIADLADMNAKSPHQN
jgi:hypothetical protein